MTAVEGSLSSPTIKPGDQGFPAAANLNAAWILGLLDSKGGVNNFEAAVIYTNGGNTFYIPGGTQNLYSDVNHVVQIFDKLVWSGMADHDNDAGTPDQWVSAVATDYDYPARPADANPCP